MGCEDALREGRVPPRRCDQRLRILPRAQPPAPTRSKMTNGEIDLAVVRRVTRDDAAWFRAHPSERTRYRPYVDGETDTSWLDTPPVPPNGTLELLVEVERTSEHTRRRTFCWTVRVDPSAHHHFMSTVDEDED